MGAFVEREGLTTLITRYMASASAFLRAHVILHVSYVVEIED